MHPPSDPPPSSQQGALQQPAPGYDERAYGRRRRRPDRGGGGGKFGVFVLALIIGLMLGGSCVTCATLSEQDTESFFARGERVGVVEVVGAIVDSRETVQAIRRFANRDDVVGIVLRIDSPGGAVAPSQAIYAALRAASKKKPVVATMASMAASGGYWISLGADWVFAEAGTITGSIGVVVSTTDLQGVAEALRFRMRTYKSGPLKDMGSSYRDPTPEDEAIFMAMVNDIYDQFITLTAERRGQSLDQVRKVADGRIMTGRAALEADLIDELGGLYAAAKKAVLLAQARQEDGVQTSSTAYDDVEDPVLVYPPEPAPTFAELVGVKFADAVRQGVAEGLRTTLKPADETTIELR